MAPATAVLMVITCAEQFGTDATVEMAEAVSVAAAPGRVILQLRDRTLPDGARLQLGQRLRRITREAGQWLSVNERLDLACLLDADGLHLPTHGPSPDSISRWLATKGRRLFLSAAGHDPANPPRNVDAWVLSPVVAARKGRPALGFDALRDAMRRAPGLATFALGGLGPDEVASCRALGARIAVQGAAYERPTDLIRALGIRRDVSEPE